MNREICSEERKKKKNETDIENQILFQIFFRLVMSPIVK